MKFKSSGSTVVKVLEWIRFVLNGQIMALGIESVLLEALRCHHLIFVARLEVLAKNRNVSPVNT